MSGTRYELTKQLFLWWNQWILQVFFLKLSGPENLSRKSLIFANIDRPLSSHKAFSNFYDPWSLWWKPSDFRSNISAGSKKFMMHFGDVTRKSFPCRIPITSQIRKRSNTQGWPDESSRDRNIHMSSNWWKNRPMPLLHNENYPYWQN